METIVPIDKKERMISNDLTWPRRVILQWLRSFFKNSSDFGYNDDELKTKLVVIDGGANLDKYKEDIDRVVVVRRNFNYQSISTDNRVSVNNEMFTHSIIKPKLGFVDIFCESINDIMVEYMATSIETSLLIHKFDLLEMNVNIGDPSSGDVKKPYSGSKFNSMVVSVPTTVISSTSYSVSDPRMLQEIEVEFGIGNALDLKVKV